MRLPLYIAQRYLFSRKSHNVINIVSAISTVAMAVGAAALIVILSVYNGFDAIVKSMATKVEPDLVIRPAEGKFFVPKGEVYDWIYDCPNIKNMCTVLQDNVFVKYEENSGTALLKGVDDIYVEETELISCVTDGEFRLRHGEIPYAAIGAGFARNMGINPHFITGLLLYYPDASAKFSALNPLGSLRSTKVWPSCEFMIGGDMDTKLVVVDIGQARQVLGREDDEVSAVEIRYIDGLSRRECRKTENEIRSRLDEGFVLLDRSAQNPSLYKMLRYEKAAVYLIMVFVVLILGFSIFGSLTMLIIDKSEDIATLSAMGATPSTIRRIFTLEGWMITLWGMVAGMTVGCIACLLQQHFGIIKMPGNYIVESYPIVLEAGDIVICCLSISLLGYLIALIPSHKSI